VGSRAGLDRCGISRPHGIRSRDRPALVMGFSRDNVKVAYVEVTSLHLLFSSRDDMNRPEHVTVMVQVISSVRS
jgi:hypothetical protein